MNNKPETDISKDIAADLREDARQIRCAREIATRIEPQPTLRGRFLDEIFEAYADRLEAAIKREADSIHRAMVLIAGIEMTNSEDPPRLWTALEDAYDALSDALGTDGESTADNEEAVATGRHFVVNPSGNAAAMREALEATRDLLLPQCNGGTAFAKACGETVNKIMDALAAPPRICDVNDCEPLADFIIKSLHGSQLLKAVDALTLAVVHAVIRAALEIAYAPVKVSTSNPKEGGAK